MDHEYQDSVDIKVNPSETVVLNLSVKPVDQIDPANKMSPGNSQLILSVTEVNDNPINELSAVIVVNSSKRVIGEPMKFINQKVRFSNLPSGKYNLVIYDPNSTNLEDLSILQSSPISGANEDASTSQRPPTAEELWWRKNKKGKITKIEENHWFLSNFRPGYSTLNAEFRNALDKIAEQFKYVLSRDSAAFLQIEGYASITGGGKLNRRLSKKRANNVVNYLETLLDPNQRKFVVKVHGEDWVHLVKEQLPHGWRKDFDLMADTRSVEIQIVQEARKELPRPYYDKFEEIVEEEKINAINTDFTLYSVEFKIPNQPITKKTPYIVVSTYVEIKGTIEILNPDKSSAQVKLNLTDLKKSELSAEFGDLSLKLNDDEFAVNYKGKLFDMEYFKINGEISTYFSHDDSKSYVITKDPTLLFPGIKFSLEFAVENTQKIESLGRNIKIAGTATLVVKTRPGILTILRIISTGSRALAAIGPAVIPSALIGGYVAFLSYAIKEVEEATDKRNLAISTAKGYAARVKAEIMGHNRHYNQVVTRVATYKNHDTTLYEGFFSGWICAHKVIEGVSWWKLPELRAQLRKKFGTDDTEHIGEHIYSRLKSGVNSPEQLRLPTNYEELMNL